jgi:hypothetical protein
MRGSWGGGQNLDINSHRLTEITMLIQKVWFVVWYLMPVSLFVEETGIPGENH